jgi:uroporphyrin-III C-methyltransferase/precorrin-2 dehydrogenase/sirohydrochlorin ferrochelatase
MQEKVAIFGNGAEAAAKARLVANTSAEISVYADAPEAELVDSLGRLGIEPVIAAYAPAQIDGATLVFAATGDATMDRMIVADARGRKIPANAVDQPEFCDFLTPALVNRAPVAIAIGTEGAGPVLAQMIRARVDQMLSPSLGALARLAQDYRVAVDRLLPRGVARRVFWRRFFEADVATHVAHNEISLARRAATRMLRGREPVPGHIWLVGAGPGAEDLLTLRAQRAMMEADAIVYDALVPETLVALGRRDAERISVGKRKGCHSKSQNDINDLLVRLGRGGKRVVRLKSGDPLIFGRAGEEMAVLSDAGVSFEIVPGITSALAAAADFELPLTLRGVASSLGLHHRPRSHRRGTARLGPSCRLRRYALRLHGPYGGCQRCHATDRGRIACRHDGGHRRERLARRQAPVSRHARRPAGAGASRELCRTGHGRHRRRRRRGQFRELDPHRGRPAGRRARHKYPSRLRRPR